MRRFGRFDTAHDSERAVIRAREGSITAQWLVHGQDYNQTSNRTP